MYPQSADPQTAVVNEQLARLAALSFDALTALPEVQSEEIVINGKRFTLSIWHDLLESGEHRIVVQACKRGFLGLFGWMQADGFAVNSHNERRSLTDEERSPFS